MNKFIYRDNDHLNGPRITSFLEGWYALSCRSIQATVGEPIIKATTKDLDNTGNHERIALYFMNKGLLQI